MRFYDYIYCTYVLYEDSDRNDRIDTKFLIDHIGHFYRRNFFSYKFGFKNYFIQICINLKILGLKKKRFFIDINSLLINKIPIKKKFSTNISNLSSFFFSPKLITDFFPFVP